MCFSVIIWVTEPYFKFLSYKLVAYQEKKVQSVILTEKFDSVISNLPESQWELQQ